jgi:hypothetical protein
VIYHGRWGAAAFPSVYQGGVDSWTCLPQMLEWQAGTALALVSGIFFPQLLVVAGLMFAATVWRCFAHAWKTKLDNMATVDSASARLKHRLMIAWLHYIQLWARFRGRVKGYFSPSNITPEGRRLMDGAPWLSLADSFRLLVHRLDGTYWDTRYRMIDEFLLSVKRIGEQALSPVRCDDGWRQEYDLRVRACRNCSMKIKLTAEDHGGMKRLFRARIELHNPWRFRSLILAAAALGGGLTHSLGYVSIVPAAVFALVALTFVLRQTSKYGGQTLAALEVAAQELNLHSLVKTHPAGADKSEPVFEEN